MKFVLENPETTFVGKFKNILLGMFLCIAWIALVISVQTFFDPVPKAQYELTLPIILQYIFWSCMMAPLTEELIFRHAPLKIASLVSKEAVLPVILASSVIFGICHHHGYLSVIKQGVLGFVFACVYIKNGYSYWSSITLHSMWNLYCLFAF